MPEAGLVELQDIRGTGGALVVAEQPNLPFAAARLFLLTDVPAGELRGTHAHRQCEQFLIAVRGVIECTVDDGSTTTSYVLDRPSIGLYMPAMTWGGQRYGADAILAVLASHPYEQRDYIEDYDEFVALARS